MRIKLIKIFSVLMLSLIPQFIWQCGLILLFPTLSSLWWVGFIISFLVAVIIHNPVVKWIEENKDIIPK
jgi:hypothetical protein